MEEAWAALQSAVANLDKWGSPDNTNRLLGMLHRQRKPAHRPAGSHGINAVRSCQLLLHVLQNPAHSATAIAQNLHDRGEDFGASVEATSQRITRVRTAMKKDGREAVVRKTVERWAREAVGLNLEDARKTAESELPRYLRLGTMEQDIN